MLFRFMAFSYLRFTCLIFAALQVFFIGIDTLKYVGDLPDSANLVVLLIAYEFLNAFAYTFPISVMLASVAVCISVVKSSQFSAILSLGYSKKRTLAPLFIIAAALNLAFIALSATPIAYAQENIDSIIARSSLNDAKADLLVKHDKSYVYIGKIYPILQKAENIKVFETDGLELTRFIQAPEAHFDGRFWNLSAATITTLPRILGFDAQGSAIQSEKSYQILENFKPKILDTIYQNKPNISLTDALNAFLLLRDQGANTQKIRTILYAFIAIPLAVPFCVLIVGYHTPSLARYANLARLGFSLVLFCLMVWGVFFTLTRLANSGFMSPEVGILAPLLIFIAVAIFHWRRI